MNKKILKQCAFILGILIVLAIVAFIIIKYDEEGEKSLPYSISKILLVSTVNGSVIDDPENIWNINVSQVNDMYMYIDKTEETDETIKEIKFENFVINTAPKMGNLKILRPTGELANLYTYSSQDYLKEGLTYIGAAIDDMKSLEISNIGGVLGFRFLVDNLGNYVSKETEEVTYDGKLLAKLGVTVDDIKFNVSFDIIITTSDNINYKGTINLDMPVGDVVVEGASNKEITDFSNVIFKRV